MSIHATASVTIEHLEGVLIGTAVGDSIGLPMEGLSARRQKKLFDPPLRQRLVGSHGMISDDTEHTVMVAQALLDSGFDPDDFQRRLARSLRWWLAALPAGVGFATLRAILKLWLGFSPQRSGMHSAGNGPAMRSALLGVYFCDDERQLHSFVRASAEITHRDPRAATAAIAVAETARWMVQNETDFDRLLSRLRLLSDQFEWQSIISSIGDALRANQSTLSLAQQIGARCGVSGYALQSVPVAIYAALRNQSNFASALTEVIECGGDTDTTGAITGGLVGARVGIAGIPEPWREGIADFPYSTKFLHQIAARLFEQHAAKRPLGAMPYAWTAIPIRNLAFLIIVLSHGLRRLLPPY